MSKNNIYGYIRASKPDDGQLATIEKFGVTSDCLFIDEQNSHVNRDALVERLSVDDTVIVASLDCLGKDCTEIARQFEIITRDKKANIVVLDMPLLDTRGKYVGDPTGQLITNISLQIFSYVAKILREKRRRCAIDAIAAAKNKGVRYGGRSPIQKPKNYEKIVAKWKVGEISGREAARLLKVSRPTFYKWTKEGKVKWMTNGG